MKGKDIEIKKSLIIPIYKNELNITSLLEAIENIAKVQGEYFEAIFVVDGSPDNSYSILKERLYESTFKSQLILLSRNFGSFVAIRTGLENARGKYFAAMAADLQEPPELINTFFKELSSNSADVIFGQRTSRKDKLTQRFLAEIYWNIYRKVILKDIPKGGVDIFACNDKVKNSILEIEEPNSSLVAQLFWVGHRRLFIPYARQERKDGRSAWSISKRIKYMLDSIFSYSDAPILVILWLGAAGLAMSLILGSFTLSAKLLGWIDIPGYTTLLFGILFFSSLILTTQGIIGCYLWRAFENTKRRPLSIIENKDLYK